MLRVLVEDKTTRADLQCEHGLSLYIEAANFNFVFDCGQSGLAWKNALKMGVDLSAVNFVVISHSHYDHAGGFPKLLEYVKPKVIYTGVNFWQEKFSKVDGGYKYRGAGFTAEDLSRWGITQKICRDIIQLDDDIFLIGNFLHKYAVNIPKKFVCGVDKHADNFADEICLVIRKGDALTAVVGCSHVGILNIIATIEERLHLPVKTVIGGIHLIDADEDIVDKTLDALKHLGVENFALCHCSGDRLNAGILSTGNIFDC